MASYLVLSDATATAASTNAFNLAGGDSLFLASKATIAASGGGGRGIYGSGDATLSIAGVVYASSGTAIFVVGYGSIDVTGQVISGLSSAVNVEGGGDIYIGHAGVIVAKNGTGVYSASTTNAARVFNDGSISAYNGAFLNGVFSTFNNTGTVNAGSYGLIISSGGARVVNSGAIISGGAGLYMVSSANTTANDVINSGTLTAIATAISAGDAADRITNTGTIVGAVFLYGGADVLDTTAGVLRGTVDMGLGDDIFLGSALGDVVLGGGGSDTLKGYGGDDRLTGGAGGDVLSGGEGADTFIYLGVADAAPATPDLITDFETGIDKIDISALGPGGAVAINLGIGNSTVYFQTASGAGGQGVISLYGTVAASDILVGGGTTFFITGTRLADIIVGTSGVDYITGGAGADTLTGGAGADVFVYGSVADSPSGANDVILDFETGSDKLDFTALGAGSAIAINMGPWSTVYYQTATSGSQGVIGVSGIVRGADLNVSSGATVYIAGTAGADVIYGSNVVDYISGGAGDDSIAGGLGADVLTGGAGSDAFYVFSVTDSLVAAPDRITDFDPSADYIDLSGIDANTGAAGQQHFTLVAGFTGAAGQLVSYVNGGFIHFDGDVNGDGVADFAVLVTPTAYWDPYADPSHLRL